MKALRSLIIGIICFFPVDLRSESKSNVGIILPLSGSAASWGEGLKSSALMAYDTLSEEYKNKIQLIFEDDRFDPKTAISIYRFLVDEKKVKGIIVFGSNSALAIAPLAERDKTPLIVLGLSPKAYQGRKWVIQHWLQVSPLVEKILFIAKEKSVKSLSIITSEHESYASIQKEIIDKAPTEGISISYSETVPLENKDLSYLIPKLKNISNSLIAVCLLPEQNKSFASSALKAKLNLNIVGCNGLDTPSLSKEEESFFKGVYYPAVDFNPEFLAKFRSLNPNKEWIGAGNIYDAVNIFADALGDFNQENELTLKKIKTSQTKSFPFKSYKFNEEGYFEIPITIKKIEPKL